MIFALDATPLREPTGGIRRYTDYLAHALAAEFPEDEHWLISDQPFSAQGAANLRCQTYSARHWWSLGLPRTLAKIDAGLFHGTDFAVPYVPLRPSVLTLHDLSPWMPDFAGSPRVRLRTPLLLRSGIPTLVITPSEVIRRAAIEKFGLNANRAIAIPLAASGCFRPFSGPPPAAPYFLYVGSSGPRKNVAGLVEAWREVRKTHPIDLVLAGTATLAPETGLHLLGVTSDAHLQQLYSQATALVCPSLYEGFGLPVLEAMQCGALVIASRDPALMEVTGGAALHVDVSRSGELARAMTQALPGTDHLRALRQKALARASQFSWRATARRTREVYDEAIRVFAGS